MNRKQFPYGEILPEIPHGFIPPEMWPEYAHVVDPAPICRVEQVGDAPSGIRWSFWPFTFEEYYGDAEPVINASPEEKIARNRIALWRRLYDAPIPRGWFRGPAVFRVDGYQFLDESDYTERWGKKTRRDFRVWRDAVLGKTHAVEKISFDEYSAAYKKSTVAHRTGMYRIANLERKLTMPAAREHTRFFGVRNIETGEIIAGTAVIYSPTYKSSTHFAPFIHKEGRGIFAATGLVDHWFSTSRAAGYPHVLTTNFWHKGKPKDWKGFSQFKSHFGFSYLTYPPVLWKFVAGKLF